MLQNLAELLKPAREQGYAVACFNIFGYEDALAVVKAAEQRQASVILSINLDMSEFMPLEHIIAMFKPLAESTAAPVCLHLDHTYDINSVKRAIDLGFTSVMYDCSQKSIGENIDGIADVVAYAADKRVSVEAEVGSVPYASGRDHIKSALTDIDEARAMEIEGNPDALAISIGNVHRLENGCADINFDHFRSIREAIGIPLVIHGASGIESADIQKLAQSGVCKFNIGTNLRKRFGTAMRETLESDPTLFDRLTIMRRIIPELKDEAGRMIELLGQ
ncbi:MAG: class II fructose-bisphosphate aldolase family protein [Gammaproteobacteria bacterium]|nr:class II fructose-bisphosphate aldolase family protein [Gammaproteobacteria bacterium]